jgi:hypothetical protein
MTHTATTLQKRRLLPPQLGVSSPRGGHTSPVLVAGVHSPEQGKTSMIKNRIAPRHIDMRPQANGTFRPRFAPGARLRKLGHKSYDLKHPNGEWFSFEECHAFSRKIEASTAESRHPVETRGPSSPHIKTLGQLCEIIFTLPEFNGGEAIGKRITKGLSPKTVWGYRHNKNWVKAACDRLAQEPRAKGLNMWDAPANQFTPSAMQAIIDNVHEQSGLASARATRAFLSTLWTKLGAKEQGANPFIFKQLTRMETLEGTLAPWSVEQFLHMVATADANNRPELADMFIYGVLHGQRQSDRLVITIESETETHITVKQSKRGKVVTLTKPAMLATRLEAAKKRRAKANVHWPHLFIDETAGRPWAKEGDHYRHVFAQIRDIAAITMPSCKTLLEKSLRATNQTWAAHAGTDPKVLAKMAGHSPSSFAQLQKKHYVAPDQQQADAAVNLLEATIISAMAGDKEELG